jgi:hypothetical protein
MTDHDFQITAGQRDALRRLQTASKFTADRSRAYAGAPSERIRALCESAINDVLGQLLDLPDAVRVDAVHRIVRRALTGIDAFDSNERDRYCAYLEQGMDLLGVADAANLLDKWRYGIA